MTALSLLLLLASGPHLSDSQIPIKPDPRSKNVLVVRNANAPESAEIADFYMKHRAIPKGNLVIVRTTTKENIPRQTYEIGIRDAVRDHIAKKKLDIDFIVLIRGVPLRLDNNGGYAVDAFLAVDAHPSRAKKPLEPLPKKELTTGGVRRVLNPYFRAKQPFDSDKYGLYLVTRLDGYTAEDAIGLVMRSLKAEPAKGEFLFDASPAKSGGGYRTTQQRMFRARDLLQKKGLRVSLDEGEAFIGGRNGLMGYAGWGSNDPKFKKSLYNSLRFRPGALAETFVSTSGRTFRRTTGGQSLIADLIQQGVTGVKGYVSEPYTLALAHVDILFDRYTDGRNLAESFYAASPLLKWKDVVLGDPLCAPYRK
ncbi:MAG: TIGR03790 family protein [Armatimonadetes bacterium]|nr:TIGR03790 family protein [Armatimonadota bacterium]